MFDAVRVIALGVAAISCLRTRYALGLFVTLAIAAVDAPAMVLPLVRHEALPPSLFFGFVLVFWGPSGLPWPPTRVLALDLLGLHPEARTALTAALALVAMARADGRSKPLRPETSEARSWDAISIRLLFVGVLDCLLTVIGVLFRYFFET